MRVRMIAALRCGAAALALMGGAAERARGGAMGAITDLGTGGAYGLDNAGEVLTDKGLLKDGVTTTLPLPPPPHYFPAISPGGTIAYSQGHGGYGATLRGYVLKDGKVSDVGTASNGPLAGGDSYSIAHAVNDSGAVAGESHAYSRFNQAFTSAPGPNGIYQPISMGAHGGTVSNATAINNPGTVVGWSDVAGMWQNHAFVGTPSHDIGTLGGQNSQALGINDKGQVVGWSTLAVPGYTPPSHPDSYYDLGATHAFFYQDGKMSDLGTPAGFQNSQAQAINASGQAVGMAYNGWSAGAAWGQGDFTLAHAALFDASTGKATDLNDLLPAGSGWVLKDAFAINDSGLILGTGTLNGEDHSFLLQLPAAQGAPVPEPGSLAIAAVGIVGVAWGRSRRKARS